MKFAFIERQRLNHKITTLCRVIEVSKAGFYDWRERARTPPTDRLALETAARAGHERGRQTYGPKRLQTELAHAGFKLSVAAVKRLRKRLGLRCKYVRKYKATTDSQHQLPIAPNLLDRQFANGSAYIEIFYNRIRRHSKINNLSPAEFEQQWYDQQVKKVA